MAWSIMSEGGIAFPTEPKKTSSTVDSASKAAFVDLEGVLSKDMTDRRVERTPVRIMSETDGKDNEKGGWENEASELVA